MHLHLSFFWEAALGISLAFHSSHLNTPIFLVWIADEPLPLFLRAFFVARSASIFFLVFFHLLSFSFFSFFCSFFLFLALFRFSCGFCSIYFFRCFFSFFIFDRFVLHLHTCRQSGFTWFCAHHKTHTPKLNQLHKAAKHVFHAPIAERDNASEHTELPRRRISSSVIYGLLCSPNKDIQICPVFFLYCLQKIKPHSLNYNTGITGVTGDRNK